MTADHDDLQRRLRALPGVDGLLGQPAAQRLAAQFGRALVVEALRDVLAEARAAVRSRAAAPAPDHAALLAALAARLQEWASPSLLPAINATGIIVHTNLGRAPLSAAALAALHAVGRGYSNLEYDLEEGARSSRSVHAADLLRRVVGAPAATVVNNAAGAVLLMLSALAHGRDVVISRGQLVEIGGGFRMPDVMQQAGVRLVEVGTTNRTHLRDYAAAITPQTAAILVVHHSNFRIVGFTAEPTLAELAALARERGLPLLFDQGSGALLDTARFGLAREPLVQEALAAGCAVVAFSGDKLLGGPQAGILVGQAEPIAAIKRHPLARALRPDKLCLAALAATLRSYLTGSALEELPVWQMIGRSAAALAATAHVWQAALASQGVACRVVAGESAVGGGSLPGQTLPTWLAAVEHPTPDRLAQRLRTAEPRVIARIQGDAVCLDPRTVLPDQEEALLTAVVAAWRALPAAAAG